MVQVYAEPLCRRHFASVLGAGVLIRLVLLLLAIGLSIVIAFATGGFWVKIKPTHDQATVHYTHDALLLFEGAAPGQEMVWSTSPTINAEFVSSFIPASVQVGEEDLNFDGKPDVITFIATVQSSTPVHGVKALLQFTYNFHKNVKLDMYSLAYLSASSATPGGTLFTDGDLVLNQRSPITDRLYNDNYNAPLLSSSNPSQQLAAQASTELQFETILKSYLDHNYTTYYTNHYPVWKAGTGNTFELQMRIRIPPNQLIWYRPQVIEMLKFGWIQFLATFVVLMWIVHYMEVFIFRYRLVGTRIMSDTQPRGQKF